MVEVLADNNVLIPLALLNLLILTGIAIAVGKSLNHKLAQKSSDKYPEKNLGDSAEPTTKAQTQVQTLDQNLVQTKEAEISTLKQECLRLRQKLQQQQQNSEQEFRQTTFNQLQSLLTQYPSLIKMVEAKPDLPAKNLVALLIGLDQLWQTWQYQPIGSAWQQVQFDPQLHQPDLADIEAGELVYVRFIGYRHGEQILVPAKVSRTLPGGLSK